MKYDNRYILRKVYIEEEKLELETRERKRCLKSEDMTA